MSKSSLVSVNIPAHSSNYTKGRSDKKISEITIHHMAGVMSAEQCGKIFQQKGRNGSSHYGIGNNGKIGQYVDEANTAWTNSNWEANCRAVTIETSNNKTGGDWTVGDKALKSLIKLVADIAKRNKLGTLVPKKNLTYHSMYAATTCPGNYLRSKIQYIADEANKINNSSASKKYVEYRVYSNPNKKWFDKAKDGQTAGDGTTIGGFQVYTYDGGGSTKIKAHIKGAKWLSEVVDGGYGSKNSQYAGIKGKPVDAIMVKDSKMKLKYRVKTKKSGWLPYVTGYDTKDWKNGYAGNFGEEIVAIQIKKR